ncbi:MAG: winged helix DNA-binding domain-containing protein [Myxococcaceae bacterium]|nr:winged helix DNA-binding domain-containing protein [Myxococcaceae bacterium]
MPLRGRTDELQIRASRLAAQGLTAPLSTVAEVARRLLGLQGQDLTQVRWALGARMRAPSLAAVDEAFASGELVRTWSLRGTLHVMPAEDAGWVVRLLGPRNLARGAGRLRQLGVTEADVRAVRSIAERVLRDGPRSRAELFARFEAAGQATATQRGIHLLFCLSQAGVLVQAGEDFVLPEGRGPRPRVLDGDDALAALATRYLEGHGPATAEDLAFWSGLTLGEARRAMGLASIPRESAGAVPPVLLLAGFDEYLLGYTERSAVISPAHFERVCPGSNGVFRPMLVLDGVIRGTWRRERSRTGSTVELTPFARVPPGARAAVSAVAERYARFLDEPVAVRWGNVAAKGQRSPEA